MFATCFSVAYSHRMYTKLLRMRAIFSPLYILILIVAGESVYIGEEAVNFKSIVMNHYDQTRCACESVRNFNNTARRSQTVLAL